MYKRFILTEEDKNEIVSLYSQKNIVLEQAADEKPVTVQDIQNKLIELGYGDMLGKFGADGKFGKMTYSAITQAISGIEQKKASQSSVPADAATSIQSKDAVSMPTTSTADKGIKISTVSALSQMNKDIKTPYDAQQAINAAKLEADKIKEQGKITQEMCRTIGRAVNPINPFKKEVASQSLCDALRNCISNNMLVRDDSVFTACSSFPAKPTAPASNTQPTNTTTV